MSIFRSISKSKLITFSFCAFGVALAAAFQNCSKVSFSTEQASLQDFMSTASLKINDGAPFTQDQIVTVQILANNASEMFITNDAACETGGSWEKFQSERKWALGQLNTRATVYAKFKTASGMVRPCINASIVHDDISPEIQIVDRPLDYMNEPAATYTFRGEDAGSGIDYYECRSNTDTWARCESPWTLRDLPEGSRTSDVRVIDRAGNASQPANHLFLVDRVAPTVRFTQTPAEISNSSTAIFRFEANDSASGVDSIYCQLDSLNTAGQPSKDCTSPANLIDLGSMDAEVNYRFSVWAFDRAGNRSDNISYDFIVDRAKSGAFQVIGVTGDSDKKIDDILGTVPNPIIHWTPSTGAAAYEVSVLSMSEGNQVVCASVTVPGNQTVFGYTRAACTLADGESYRARVVATDSVGNLREAPLFTFRVDLTGPTIKITGPTLSNDTKDARFDFTVTDPSGIDTTYCYKGMSGAANESQSNCKDKTVVSYTNLMPGDHTFRLIATDGAGNTAATEPITWKSVQVVCDPFSPSGDELCKRGLRANLYYLTADMAPFKEVDRYIKEGVKANALIYMSKLFVPTKPWTTGFASTDGTVVKDNAGNKLFEYFALDLETVVKLDPAANSSGNYQFAILSDDGAVVEIRDPTTKQWKTFINNDGDHPTKLGCDTEGLYLNGNSRIPMRIKYYQGPRLHIALSLLWRKITTDVAVTDELCGKSGNNLFFGVPELPTAPNYTDFGYGDLVKRGWKPLDSSNFILEEDLDKPAK